MNVLRSSVFVGLYANSARMISCKALKVGVAVIVLMSLCSPRLQTVRSNHIDRRVNAWSSAKSSLMTSIWDNLWFPRLLLSWACVVLRWV